MNGKNALYALLALTQFNCATPLDQLPLTPRSSLVPESDLQLKYLGAGGLFIRRGSDVVLTAPFFTNPTLKRLALWTIASNKDEIDRHLQSMRSDLKPTRAILVGHAHYDHLMDLPHILDEYTPAARVFGSNTARHTLAAAVDTSRLVALNDRTGEWIYIADGRVRFMALPSEHAPHFMGIKVYGGTRKKDLDRLPRRAGGWKEGQTLSYLIDFMGERDTIDYRLYYQDAGSNPPRGFPPDFSDPKDRRRIDLALLCVAGYGEVKAYPDSLAARFKPRRTVLIHWENFFSRLPERDRDLRPVPFLDMGDFISRLEAALPADADYILPAPGAWITPAP